MVSWGSQEESGEAEAACWPVGSLLSVTPAKTVQEAGLFSPAKAGLDQPLRLFLTAFSPPPPTPALTSLSLGQAATGFLVHPHTPPLPRCFCLQAFCTHSSHLEGSWSVFQTNFLFFFKNVSIYLAALGLSCVTRDLRCGMWVALVACMGSRGLGSCGTWA